MVYSFDKTGVACYINIRFTIVKRYSSNKVRYVVSFHNFNYHIGMQNVQFTDIQSTATHWIREAATAILFPDVCLCCGVRHSKDYICDYCMRRRFQNATNNQERASGDTLLPDGVVFQHALWQFDKSGSLQNLLHQLKYNHLYGIGVRLGSGLGRSLKSYRYFNGLQKDNMVLLPVPLHSSKYKMRGYNQARAIAEGIHRVTRIPLLDNNTVTRSKKTTTQTGLSMKKRLANMEAAFQVNQERALEGKLVMIVDDVFTTGATSFELARTLKNAGAAEISIATIAQA